MRRPFLKSDVVSMVPRYKRVEGGDSTRVGDVRGSLGGFAPDQMSPGSSPRGVGDPRGDRAPADRVTLGDRAGALRPGSSECRVEHGSPLEPGSPPRVTHMPLGDVNEPRDAISALSYRERS